MHPRRGGAQGLADARYRSSCVGTASENTQFDVHAIEMRDVFWAARAHVRSMVMQQEKKPTAQERFAELHPEGVVND